MTASTETPGSSPARLRSLDAMRGFDMLWIVGLAQLFREWAKVSDAAWLQTMTLQLTHVTWDGLRAYDLIFPVFMFLSGISIPLAMERRLAKGGSVPGMLAGVWRRVLLLVFLGAVYNGFLGRLEPAEQRWASVLGQIGIAYGIAATVYLGTKTWKGRAIGCGFILAVIPVLQLLVPVPGHGAGVLTPEGIINGWLDRMLLPGRLYEGYFDPEGILGAISAAALTLAGVLTGSYLQSRGPQPRLLTVPVLVAAGAVSVLAGWACWKAGYPPIKAAWNTPFNFLAAGIALGVFALFHLLVDFIHFNWSLPLQVVGMNPLTIYLGARIVPFPVISTFFLGGLAAKSQPWGQMILVAGVLLIEWLVLFFLYRKKVFLRV